tara:strand:+ start:54 stop:731 length:678 start_codon:yes stop_codon:yes gene_type:complete
MNWIDTLLGQGGSVGPEQLGLNLGKIEGGGLVPRDYLTKGGELFKPPSTLNRVLGKHAMGTGFLSQASQIGKGSQYMQGVKGVAGKAVPLFVALDAATELADEKDPFGKNLAEGLGKAGGTVGGAWGGAAIGGALGGGVLSPVTAPIGAILGAILMSETGKKLAGGAYTTVNPEGVTDHRKKMLRRAAEIEMEKDAIRREIAMARAKDQQKINLENAMINTILGR